MKYIIITSAKIRRELWILLGSFAVAYGMNIYSIIHYARPASELYMTIGYVLVTAVCIYLILAVVRILIHLVIKLFTKHK